MLVLTIKQLLEWKSLSLDGEANQFSWLSRTLYINYRIQC